MLTRKKQELLTQHQALKKTNKTGLFNLFMFPMYPQSVSITLLLPLDQSSLPTNCENHSFIEAAVHLQTLTCSCVMLPQQQLLSVKGMRLLLCVELVRFHKSVFFQTNRIYIHNICVLQSNLVICLQTGQPCLLLPLIGAILQQPFPHTHLLKCSAKIFTSYQKPNVFVAFSFMSISRCLVECFCGLNLFVKASMMFIEVFYNKTPTKQTLPHQNRTE